MVAPKAVMPGAQVGAASSVSESRFKEVLREQVATPTAPEAIPIENAPRKIGDSAPISKDARIGAAERAAGAIQAVQAAQKRMEQVMALAASGRNFSPAELLSFQAKVYQCSQEIDLAGKVVDKAGGGLRQILQTQL